MTRSRAQLRTARTWRDYDRANFWVSVALFGVFALWMLWSQTHPEEDAPPALADGPVQMRKAPATAAVAGLDLRVVGLKLVLTGSVPDDEARRALRAAGEAAFGAGQVDDRLNLDPQADPMAWRDHLPDMLRTLRTTGGDAAMRIDGKQVTLTGEVPVDSVRSARELVVQNWFGRSTKVDNQLRVAAAASAPVASASASVPSLSDIVVGAGPAAAPAAMPAAAPASLPGAAAAAPNPACAPLAAGVAVRFHPNAPALTDEGRRTLRELMPCLTEGRWTVGVHTDSNGDPASNQALTQGRAEAVVAYLVGRKLPAERLSPQGFGSSRPVSGNDTPEDRLKNRRVTFERQP
ncbi:outer membrane protein/peptidoglycan-associated (lipo)protein [Burkholderiales bacterium JOSHI_001]|nr:outer membrane protein/peptidoglycan-associated (lipo)protein [Burkholderiales bacterium JOSHI_001]